MKFVKRWFLHNSLKNYNYLIINDHLKSCLIIDPAQKDIYVDLIEQDNLAVEGILLTHEHGDHIAAVEDLYHYFKCPVYSTFHQLTSHKLSDQQSLKFNTADCQVLYTPGHTSVHVCFYFAQENWLLCGDTIFVGGVGNDKAKTADVNQLYDSIQQLMKLPEQTRMYPAHDYAVANLRFALTLRPDQRYYRDWLMRFQALSSEAMPVTTLAQEKQMNIFMQTREIASMGDLLNDHGEQLRDEKEIFCYLRKKRNVF